MAIVAVDGMALEAVAASHFDEGPPGPPRHLGQDDQVALGYWIPMAVSEPLHPPPRCFLVVVESGAAFVVDDRPDDVEVLVIAIAPSLP